jgi:acyl-CoA synthetase (AMP-forming)/AMP-acid ligase II
LDQSLRLAAAFQELGIKEGDSIGLIGENNMESYVVFLATFYIGAAIAPINPTYVESKYIIIKYFS